MIRRPPISTRTDTLFPYTTLFRSVVLPAQVAQLGREQRIGALPVDAHVGLAGLERREQARGRVEHDVVQAFGPGAFLARSEEHTSELKSLMRMPYGVFCLKKNKKANRT